MRALSTEIVVSKSARSCSRSIAADGRNGELGASAPAIIGPPHCPSIKQVHVAVAQQERHTPVRLYRYPACLDIREATGPGKTTGPGKKCRQAPSMESSFRSP